MEKVFYDLHMHSCLSPCADDDMTPANMAGMARLKGLDIAALTDHNSCRNCLPFVNRCKENGILALAGMEINTEEEIHAVCLFEDPDNAMAFDQFVYERLPAYRNDPEIYGHQYVVDENDNIVDEIEKLLISACDISIMDLKSIVSEFHGVCFPAHIDKPSYSILAVLGFLPPECGFSSAEISRFPLIDKTLTEHPELEGMNLFTDSDAHYLWDISERCHYKELHEKSLRALLKTIG